MPDQYPHFDPIRVHNSFERQRFMVEMGARLLTVEPGRVEIELPHHEALTQQHGYLHAGAITAVVDSACGYAALSVMPPDAGVLSVEFKVNLLAPGAGQRYLAVGTVDKAGRTLTICRGEVHAETGGERKLIALMQATMMAVKGRGLAD